MTPGLVKSAFATLPFPISDIEAFHTGRGSEFDSAEIDLMLEAFGIERSLPAKGCPYDNAVDESANRILKAELDHRETFGTTRGLRAKLSDYVHRYDNFRIQSTPGHTSPVEFRKAGLSPSRNPPNRCCQYTAVSSYPSVVDAPQAVYLHRWDPDEVLPLRLVRPPQQEQYTAFMGTSSERVSNGSGKGYLPAGTIGNRTHILSEQLKVDTEFKWLKKGHRPVPMSLK